jgi:two-component system chemotaxis sensor kinase CheA
MNYIDDQVVNEFIEESNELLSSIEEYFLELDSSTEKDKTDLIHKIFRAIHTIKGSAGLLNFDAISDLSHLMETLLSKLREGLIEPEAKYIDALLSGSDKLKIMLEDVSKSSEVDSSEEKETISNFLDNINIPGNLNPKKNTNFKSHESYENEPIIPIPKFKKPDFISDINELIKTIIITFNNKFNDLQNIFLCIEDKKSFTNEEKVKIIRFCDLLINVAKYTHKKNIYFVLYILKDITNKIYEQDIVVDDELIQFYFEVVTKTNTLFEAYDHSDETDISELIRHYGLLTGKLQKENVQQQNQLIKKEENKLSKKENIDLNEKSNTSLSPKKEELNAEKHDTVRLNINILDKLMRLAGELVLVRNQQLIKASSSLFDDREIIQRLDSITTEIQESVMQTRLQPIGNIYSKFNRTIRDIKRKLGKEIRLDTSGYHVELDKSIIETLAGPMIHIIRNAADHGIETPEERKKLGKPVAGTISISAYHEGGLINISISDDGKGIQPDKIKSKALEKGIKTQTELDSMSEKELINLILLPGFSTSDQISDLSGRGVGLDVVTTSIEKLNGSVEINSKPGLGTTFQLKLPLTLAIIPCLIVLSNGYRYAIPQTNLEELVSINSDSKYKIENTGYQEVFRLRNNLIPVIRLNDILENKVQFDLNTQAQIVEKYSKIDQFQNNGKLNFAVLRLGNNKFGLIIDQVLGTEEIVVKPMHSALNNIKIYSGGTILGDGQVALILNIEGLAKHCNLNFNLNLEKTKEISEKNQVIEKESVLIFKAGVDEQYALALPFIQRVEQINPSSIENVGDKEFIKFGDKTLKILKLENLLDVSDTMYKEEMYLIIPKHINLPIGILVSEIIDTKELLINLNTQSYFEKGILGTDFINNRLTLFIDIFQLIELFDPAGVHKVREEIVDFEINQEEKNQIRILLVEDSSIFRQIVKSYLENDGFNVDVAKNGKEGLLKFKKKNYDLLISDIEMPIMNGFELIENIRGSKFNSDIPAMALSSFGSEQFIRKAHESGFDFYEIKLQKDNIIKRIGHILRNYINPELESNKKLLSENSVKLIGGNS